MTSGKRMLQAISIFLIGNFLVTLIAYLFLEEKNFLAFLSGIILLCTDTLILGTIVYLMLGAGKRLVQAIFFVSLKFVFLGGFVYMAREYVVAHYIPFLSGALASVSLLVIVGYAWHYTGIRKLEPMAAE